MTDKPEDVRGEMDPTASPIDQFTAAQHSRRNVMKWGSMLSALSMTGALAACGSSDADDGSPLPAPTPTPTPTPTPVGVTKVSSFGLAVLPDTQFYSRYSTAATGNQFNALYKSEPYKAQTKWLVDNAAALNIPFVIHVGDVVDQSGIEAEWQVADAAMKVLEDAALPYSVIAGNHDVLNGVGYDPKSPYTGTDADRDLTKEPFVKWFGKERAAKQKTFGGRDPSGFHEYHMFQAEGQKFLVIGLSWRVSQAGIIWAQNVINSNSTLPVILVCHELLSIANDAVNPLESDYGLMLWENLIKTNDQIFMTVNGHIHGSSRLVKKNLFGNDVIEMVVDYQMAYQGGNGLMRFYEFDFTNNKIIASTFSPWVPQKPKETLNAFDQAVLTENNHAFTIDMNFAQRFKRFAPNFAAGTVPASRTSLTTAALAKVLDGYTEPKPIEAIPAKNTEDYPAIAGTTAHWRFYGGTAGTPVPALHQIADASKSGNPLTRAPIDFPTGNTAQLSDLVWADDHHRLSSAPGSVEFRNAQSGRLSYFWTALDAAVNDDEYRDGYTVEAFIKIGKDWTSAKNAWMNVMTREGRRGSIKGWYGGLPESPPLQMAISNLREVQWEAASYWSPNNDYVLARTNWTGEIIVDRWLHVAIVHDKAKSTTTMYVEGAPVLRNINETSGIANLAKRWVVGAGFWDGGPPGSGFLGAIGEIRIVPKPLLPAQWLTARAPK